VRSYLVQRSGNQYPVGKGATVDCTSIPFFYLVGEPVEPLPPAFGGRISRCDTTSLLDYDKPTPPEVQAKL